MIKKLVLLIFFMSPAQLVYAQDFLVNVFRYNHVQQPQTWGDVINELGDSPMGRAAVEAAAEAYGIPRAAVSAAFFAADSAWDKEGEEIRSTLKSPRGYSACRFDVVNRYSENGPGAMGVTVWPHEVRIYSWVQANNVFDGRNWLDYKVRILYIRNRLYNSDQCLASGEEAFSSRF